MRKAGVSSLMALGMAAAVFAALNGAPAFSETAGREENKGMPHIVFEETEHDFDVVDQQQTVKHTFKFRNEGDATLVIENIKTTCGCTGTLLSKKELPPGGQGDVEVSFSSGLSGGKKKKTIFVYSNDPQQTEAQLYITAKVVVPVEVRPRTLYWVAERNKVSARTVELLYQPDLGLNIEDLKLSSPAFGASVRPKTDVEFPGYDIELTYNGELPVGNFKETLTILTDNALYPRLEVGLRGKVVGSVRVVPDTVSLGIVKDDVLPTRTIRVYVTDREDFKITGMESTNPIVSVTFTSDTAKNSYETSLWRILGKASHKDERPSRKSHRGSHLCIRQVRQALGM
jgi:hypothetical protein